MAARRLRIAAAIGLVTVAGLLATSLIATMRERWNLGTPLTARDASARSFGSIFTLATPPVAVVTGKPFLVGYGGQALEEVLAMTGAYREDSIILAIEQALQWKAPADLAQPERGVLGVRARSAQHHPIGMTNFPPRGAKAGSRTHDKPGGGTSCPTPCRCRSSYAATSRN